VSCLLIRDRYNVNIFVEAQLFSDTIRDNLDPFGQHEDYEVWEALSQCGLSGKTPAASRLASRNASHVDLRSQKSRETDRRRQPLKNLQAEAFKPTVRPGEDRAIDDGSEVEERVTIRSLDEQVAIGGKNFSQLPSRISAFAGRD